MPLAVAWRRHIDMLKQFKPGLSEAFSVATPSNTGDGIRMGRAIGAATVNMSYFSCYPWAIDRGNGLFYTGAGRDARLYGSIHVNADGVRFVNELAEPAIVGEYVAAEGLDQLHHRRPCHRRGDVR